MVNWINMSGTIGILIQYASVNITGDIATALLFIAVALLTVTLIFRIPIEFGMLLTSPFIVALMGYDTKFLPLGGVFLFYIAIMLVKYWLDK